MLLDKMRPDRETQHFLENELKNLVDSIVVKDNLSTIPDFVNNCKPDSMSKKEWEPKLINFINLLTLLRLFLMA
jgi:hypothetical protein